MPEARHPLPTEHGPAPTTAAAIALAEFDASRLRGAPLRRWNWGAFAFTWVWGLFNGAYLPLLGLLITLIPSAELWRHALPGGGSAWVSTGTLLCTAWSVYCGLMGDRWAWKGRKWRDAAHFRAAQRGWAIATLVVAIVLAVVIIAVLAAASAGLLD
ncbi:MAG TPA: hypothetical protein VIK03_10315 [Thermoleophilia bacterium]